MNRILLVIFISLFSYKASAGPIVQVYDNLYEINTVTGLLSTHRLVIEDQAWFGDSDLARIFANELGTQLSLPNLGLGPVFGFSIYDGVGADYTKGWFYNPRKPHQHENNRAQVQNAGAGVYYTYAVAKHIGVAEVPEPNLFIIFVMACISMLFRVRRKSIQDSRVFSAS
ncbi:hypothetical protein [Neptunomonas sp. XY-337]|uniref:hypothetical protein n=1 Tax=Neptunomonas sp. XY-337 TaxID=2561897 RepID=UPI0010AA9DE4|nr:hypothetical protein [Neptunomonas sp. XY-337]